MWLFWLILGAVIGTFCAAGMLYLWLLLHLSWD